MVIATIISRKIIKITNFRRCRNCADAPDILAARRAIAAYDALRDANPPRRATFGRYRATPGALNICLAVIAPSLARLENLRMQEYKAACKEYFKQLEENGTTTGKS